MESNEQFSAARVKRLVEKSWKPNEVEQQYLDELDWCDMEALCINTIIERFNKLHM